VGEEGSCERLPGDGEYVWIVDPLDGTTNYVHGYPAFCVSVAVALGRQVLAGVIYEPLTDTCYQAQHSRGAWRNGVPIRTSNCTGASNALVAVSLPACFRPQAPDVIAMLSAASECQGIRRTGSAALNLAHVAAGHFDAFWAHEIHAWDVAAGILLVQEAGGVVTGIGGQPFDLWAADFVAAASPELHAELLPVVSISSQKRGS
jgi:myo-inositol-1(or 4)-monophosphatase